MPTSTYRVTGMTCSHCVDAVASEISSISGVDEVSVDLNVGGASRVTVTSATSIDHEAVRAAVDEAGYQLAPADG